MNRFDAMDVDLDAMHDDVRVDEENLGFVQCLVLYVCYWPGLEDRSSGPGIVSRSLSRGESASLSSKHGFFLAREKCVF